jgi:uncharacterized protein (DUF1697 family)
MPRYIAFLRAINVGGHVVTMDKLRGLFESLGFKQVETFIASGNVIFETSSAKPAALQKKIEKCLHDALGYEVATFLRTDAEVTAVAGYQPFAAAEVERARANCVGFLEAPLSADQVKTLISLKTADDEFHVNGSEFYWLSRVGQGESKFSNMLFEKKVGVRSTIRGMNTVQKLAAKHCGKR